MPKLKYSLYLLAISLPIVLYTSCTKTKTETRYIFQPASDFTITYKDTLSGITMTGGSNLVGNNYTFSGKKENDVTYEWEFGDGTTSKEAQPNHAYTQPGTYIVTLKATRTEKAFSETKKTLHVKLGQQGLLIDNDRHNKALALTEAADGGYFLCGYTDDLNYDPHPINRKYFLLKLDKDLKVQTTKRFPANFGLWSFAPIDGDEFIATGSDVSAASPDKLICLTKDGDVKWMKPLVAGGFYRDVAQTKDKGFIAMGIRTLPDGYSISCVITKTDAEGNLQWSKDLFPSPMGSYAAKLHAGNLGITVAVYRKGEVNGKFVRFSDSGIILLEKDIEWGVNGTPNTSSVTQLPNGNFVVLNHIFESLPYYIYSPDGLLLDRRQAFGNWRTYQQLAAPDNNLVMLQDHFDWGNKPARLVKLDMKGQEVWAAPFDHRYKYPEGHVGTINLSANTAISLKNGGYLVAASKWDPGSPNFRQSLMIMRVDENGNIQ
ncbi:PKD domain-containing protein [Chitinophaga deserti]|uniref:PKD domain-containing protein n=1 Tax=Chitinophaga deserti TaxID=2164099 RepID=UPI000D6B34BF|nr:PKD domain-containing protein [Chitinophaga deserti]